MIIDEKIYRQRMIQKYVNELSEKLNKPKEILMSHGLSITDFKSSVSITYEDGSTSFFKHAFFVQNEDCFAVFTEHCSYHEFKKVWLELIVEDPPRQMELF